MYSTLSHSARALASSMCMQLEKERKRDSLSHTFSLTLSIALSLSRSLALSFFRSLTLALQVFTTKMA